MEVLVQPGGSFCVCYQHPTKPKVPPSSSTHAASTPDVSTIHSPEQSPTSDSAGASSTDSLDGRPTTLPDSVETDPLDMSATDARHRAVSDISYLSSSSMSPLQVSVHQAENLDISSDLSSPGSSSENVLYPSLSLDALSSTPSGTPKTSISPLFSPLMWGNRQLASPSPTTEKLDTVDLNYSVLILHHMTVLHCSVPQIPRALAESTKLYFTPLGKLAKPWFSRTVPPYTIIAFCIVLAMLV